jgi:hypothetical protein
MGLEFLPDIYSYYLIMENPIFHFLGHIVVTFSICIYIYITRRKETTKKTKT